MKKIKLVFLIIILGVFSANAQMDTLTVKQEKKVQKVEKKAQKIEEGKMLISPIIGPGYTPELQFVIGGGGIISWSNSKKDKELPRSNMPVNLTISSTGALVVNMRPTTFWAHDNFRLNGDVWYKDMPDNYWGVGYKNGYETPKSDSTTAYQRQWFQFRGDALYRVKSDFFAGLTFDVNYTQGSDASAVVASDPNYKVYNEQPLNTGIGLIFRFDSRDVPVNAWSGLYLNAQALSYGLLGGDNNYQVVLLDYRQYKTINNNPGRVIAWQMVNRMSFGEVPYGEMSQLGNPWDLRGYAWGRYRDKSMFYWLAEYRHTFYKPNGDLSKSGIVAWVGSGVIYDIEQGSDYNNNNRWLPNFGVGYRLELQPRMNLRIDIGVGRETTGFYFNMNEAF